MNDLRLVAIAFVVASSTIACSSNGDSAGPATTTDGGSNDPDAPSPSVKITTPHEGDSFVITADSVDVDVDFDVQHFELVPLGQEGTDMGKGQVRLYVDGDNCNDPGDPGQMPLPYNKIWPNDAMEKHVGMDYCAGGVPAIDNKTHTLKAQLWHGTTALTQSTATNQITFKTTFSAEGGTDAGPEPADALVPALDSASVADALGQ